eukprot:806045-Pelagomonas_calceolata.AAC.10
MHAQDHCTFDGAWRGPPRTRSEYYVSSYFWDKGMETGIIADPKAITWTATPNVGVFGWGQICVHVSGWGLVYAWVGAEQLESLQGISARAMKGANRGRAQASHMMLVSIPERG